MPRSKYVASAHTRDQMHRRIKEKVSKPLSRTKAGPAQPSKKHHSKRARHERDDPSDSASERDDDEAVAAPSAKRSKYQTEKEHTEARHRRRRVSTKRTKKDLSDTELDDVKDEVDDDVEIESDSDNGLPSDDSDDDDADGQMESEQVMRARIEQAINEEEDKKAEPMSRAERERLARRKFASDMLRKRIEKARRKDMRTAACMWGSRRQEKLYISKGTFTRLLTSVDVKLSREEYERYKFAPRQRERMSEAARQMLCDSVFADEQTQVVAPASYARLSGLSIRAGEEKREIVRLMKPIGLVQMHQAGTLYRERVCPPLAYVHALVSSVAEEDQSVQAKKNEARLEKERYYRDMLKRLAKLDELVNSEAFKALIQEKQDDLLMKRISIVYTLARREFLRKQRMAKKKRGAAKRCIDQMCELEEKRIPANQDTIAQLTALIEARTVELSIAARQLENEKQGIDVHKSTRHMTKEERSPYVRLARARALVKLRRQLLVNARHRLKIAKRRLREKEASIPKLSMRRRKLIAQYKVLRKEAKVAGTELEIMQEKHSHLHPESSDVDADSDDSGDEDEEEEEEDDDEDEGNSNDDNDDNDDPNARSEANKAGIDDEAEEGEEESDGEMEEVD